MKKLSILFVMALVSLNGMAQKQTLDIFKTVPLPPMDGITLIVINQPEFDVYNKPNGKKRLYNFGGPGETIKLGGASIFGVKMHPTGWAYVLSASESGFVSPKVFHKAKLTPFKDWMFNTAEAVAKSPSEETWRIAKHKETGLALKESGYTADGNTRTLEIGRIKDDCLFVGLYRESVKIIYQENAPVVKVTTKQGDPFPYKEIIYGKKNSVKTNRGIRLDLSTLPVEALNNIFLPIDENAGEYGTPGQYRAVVKDWKDIEYSQWDGIDYYKGSINAELMSAPFVNEQAAINAFKATAPTNQTGTSTVATASKQRSHMEFLGLEMGGNPAQFIQALRQKGFKDGSGFSQDKTQVFLSGMVYGMQSEICVYTEGNRVNSVSVINMVNTKTAAVNRCNRLKKEISALYGGKWTTPYDGAAELTLPYGKVKYEYGMFDSGVYELSMFIIDTGTSAPAPQQTNGDDMLTIIDNQISTAKKKVQENPTAESYYELANILYLKYTKINNDSEKKNILTEIDNIYKIIIDKYPNTSAIAVIGRASIINIFNPDIKQGVAKPLYEKYLQMIEPKIKNKTYNDEEKNGYLAACLYMYRYYSELSNFKQVKYYLKKYDAVDPGNENIRKMLELLKDY